MFLYCSPWSRSAVAGLRRVQMFSIQALSYIRDLWLQERVIDCPMIYIRLKPSCHVPIAPINLCNVVQVRGKIGVYVGSRCAHRFWVLVRRQYIDIVSVGGVLLEVDVSGM